MKRLLYLLLITLTIPSLAQQEQGIYFKHFTREEGLPSSYVECILQDHDGFIWIGTAEGLCRYDGYSFFNLTNSASDSTSLIDNGISCLVEDKNHNLWVGTRNGITYLDLNTYKFKRYTNKFKDDIGNCSINTMCFINEDELLIGTMLKGIYLLNIKNEQVVRFIANSTNINSLTNNRINFVIKDNKQNAWLATEGGLEKFDLVTQKFTHIIKDVRIQNVTLDSDGYIFATGDFLLYTIDPISNSVVKQERFFSNNEDRLRQVFFDSKGNQWIAVTGQRGILLTQKLDKKTISFVYDKYNPSGLNTMSPLVIYEDRDGRIWIGTFEGGVNVLDKRTKPFIRVSSNFLSNGLQSNHVRCVFQDRDGEIWIGTKTNGMLSRFDRKTFTFTHYKHNPLNPFSLNDDGVFAIADAQPGYLWIGTLAGGLNLFEKKTGKFTSVKHNDKNSKGLLSNTIMVLLNDCEGNLWIGHNNKGIDVYNIDKKEFTHYISSSNPESLTDNRIRVIYKDNRGDIWVGTMEGLNRYDKNTHTFKRYVYNDKDTKSISNNYIFSICEDKNNNLWIGTSNGLNLMDRDKGIFTLFNKKNGFPSIGARGILGDDKGNLWISTEDGIVKFDPVKRVSMTYTKEDGLLSNELALYTQFKTQNGEMFFGSENGFNIFDPKKITNNYSLPNIVFTDFLLFNQPVLVNSTNSPLKNHISRTKELTLNYKQSVFTIEFAALNFTSPEKNQYAYKMVGFDRDWSYVGVKRSATYTNLSAGEYTFRVKASNNDGIWNEQGTSLKITVLPPPWKTWWAYAIYITFIITAFLKYRSITIKRIHVEKEHEIDQMKIKLFMNISHEFRTPLTLMINPLKKISETEDINEIKTSLNIVQKSTWKLLNLVNQLLDFRKMDKGGAPLRTREGDIISYTRQICQLFEEIARSKGIEFEFITNISELNVWLDADKFGKIMNNLLSNAFKFTDTGKVTIQIDKIKQGFDLEKVLKPNKTGEYVEIRVIDTGIGISKDDIQNIFERFYQVDQAKSGTGIGLNYVKSLVELHGGEVLVESERGAGSCFIIRIPLGESHLKEEQKDLINKGFADYFDKVAIESLQYDIESADIYPIPDIDYENANINRDNKLLLLVEDNKVLRKQIYDELKNSYNIKEASNGEDGLEKAKRLMPDLIVSDIMMPKMDGIELCRILKSELNTCHIPVILLTAKGSTENKIEGYETGADDYIPKPFSMKLLEVRIKNLIRSRVLLREKFLSSKVLAPAKDFTTNNLDEAFLEKLTAIVIENIEDADFSLTELRTKIGMGQTNLFVKLQSITGQNPSSFVRTIRLKHAASLLTQGNISIKDVCYKCGFNSPAYFTKTFKELYGQSPSEYINNNEKNNGNNLS